LHDALDLGQGELYLFVSHSRQVEVQVVEQKEVVATHFVL